MFRSILRKFLAPQSCSPIRKVAKSALRIENLEDRTVPATFTVNPGGSIQAALNLAAASGGSDTVIVNAGTYTEQLAINDASNITLKANGAVTINAPADVTPFVLAGVDIDAAVIDIYSKKVTVEGFRINGATNTDGELFAGIRVVCDGSATIKNNTVVGMTASTDAVGDIGIQIGTDRVANAFGGGTAKVNNNIVSGYEGAGVLVDGAYASASVKGNTITGRGVANGAVAQYGVQVSRGASARVENNTISNNTVDDGFTASAGVFFFQSSGKQNVAAKNTISGNATGILVQESDGTYSSRLQVVNNDVTGNFGFGAIQVTDSDFVEVKNNDVKNNFTSTGISVTFSQNVKVENNDVKNNSLADGIYLFEADCNTIQCNEVENNGYNGIYAENSSNNMFWNNETANNGLAADASATFGGNGIYIFGGQCNDIWLGESTANTDDGIRLENTANNTIIANYLACNSGWGVQLINADNTFLFLNTIVGNGAGSLFIDGDSTGTVSICNRTDSAPVREGSSGSLGTSCAYTNSHSHADDNCADLDD